MVCAASLWIFLALSSDALAGGFAPPLSIDVGSSVLSSEDGEVRTSPVVLVGLKWATIYPKRTALDLGIGYVGAMMGPDDEPSARRVHSKRKNGSANSSLSSMHGVFLEVAGLAGERNHARAWVAGRAELLRSNGENVLGFATRISAEVWTGLSDTQGHGTAYGVAALGLWTELGVRRVPSLGLVQQVSVGLSFRIPLIVSSI